MTNKNEYPKTRICVKIVGGRVEHRPEVKTGMFSRYTGIYKYKDFPVSDCHGAYINVSRHATDLPDNGYSLKDAKERIDLFLNLVEEVRELYKKTNGKKTTYIKYP
jgi:hypothetical protein